MSKATTQDRLAAKTPEAAFLHVLQQEFNFSPRVSSELLSTAQEMLAGTSSSAVRPGQACPERSRRVRLVVTSLKAPFGPPLAETDKAEVTLTVDAGAEDSVVRAQEGPESLRRGRILRLTEEALEQGGVLTQEDPSTAPSLRSGLRLRAGLARALGVDVCKGF